MTEFHEIERPVNQVLWYAIMGNTLGVETAFENSVFSVRPYSWVDDDSANEWHFWHKPSGLKLQWYKYPLRGVECNMDITHEQFLDVLRDCDNSMHPQFITEITPWWREART